MNGPVKNTHKLLTLDPDDERDINAAIAHWQAQGIRLPEGDSCTAGAVLGEICRGWLEIVERCTKAEEPTDERTNRRSL